MANARSGFEKACAGVEGPRGGRDEARNISARVLRTREQGSGRRAQFWRRPSAQFLRRCGLDYEARAF
eukprot:11191888-Lingulodinium_polyedra.AAC.1